MSLGKMLKNVNKKIDNFVDNQKRLQEKRIEEDIKRIDLETKREKKLAELRRYQNKYRSKKNKESLFGEIKF